MSQAAVDLPDPKDAAAPAAAPQNNPANSADDLLAQLAGEEIDRLLSEENATNDAAAVSNPGQSSIDSTATAEQIDAVLNAVQSPPVSQASPLETQAPPATVFEEANTAAEMRQLLNDRTIGAPKPVKTPLHVKLLVLLNAPFAKTTDLVRETMGKIAILTLFNSVAVLLYVLIFRNRH